MDPVRFSRQPKNVDEARRSTLQWWPSTCSDVPVTESTEAGTRVCQIVARRRFDERTDGQYDAEPIEYSAIVVGNAAGPTAMLRSRIQVGGVDGAFSEPLALIALPNEVFLFESEVLLEGSASCIQSLRQLGQKGERVCFTESC